MSRERKRHVSKTAAERQQYNRTVIRGESEPTAAYPSVEADEATDAPLSEESRPLRGFTPSRHEPFGERFKKAWLPAALAAVIGLLAWLSLQVYEFKSDVSVVTREQQREAEDFRTLE